MTVDIGKVCGKLANFELNKILFYYCKKILNKYSAATISIRLISQSSMEDSNF